MANFIIQFSIFLFISCIIAVFTYLKCKGMRKSEQSNSEYFLAGKSLSWFFVAGSLTLTNLNTDQLVGMNGNQMALLAWWELSAVIGFFFLAKVFLPIYYKHECTTTTELLEKRYRSKHIRALIAVFFLLGNIFIFLPSLLYTGALFMQTLFKVQIPLMLIAVILVIVGASYSIFGGLRAVAVSDSYSGILLLGMAAFIVVLSLNAIDYSFQGIPESRLTLIGDDNSPLPWHVLVSGMVLAHIYYWCTNQTVTQRAMAAKTLKEAQKGVVAASVLRILVIPPIVVIPGIVAFKLYGDIGDDAYGKVVSAILPDYLSGVFAAAIAAAVFTSFNSILNSSASLYVCDLHERYISPKVNVKQANTAVSLILCGCALLMVPVYAGTESIINLVQELFGLLSMPILSVFIACILFDKMRAEAAMITVVFGSLLYAGFIFLWMPFHYLHAMLVTFMVCFMLIVSLSKALNKKAFTFAKQKSHS